MAGALTGTAFGTNLTSRRTPVRRKHYKRHVRSIGVRATVRASAVSDASQTSAVEPFTLGLRRDAEQALLLGEPIGRGAMGVVRLCTRNSDQRKFALKTIPKSGPQSLEGQTPSVDAMGIWERKVRDEVNLHFALGASLDIVTLHDAFEDEAGVHLLIDLCDGGDLLTGTANESASKKDKSNDPWARVDDDEHQEPRNESWQPFTEAAAATTIRAMLKALAACHAHGVVHRDVKPANFLYMREPNGSRRAKLSDFGLAARIKNSGDMLTERCGTYAYLSPEMARRRPYDFKVDSWAAGVVAYMLLAGEPPFADWDAIADGRDSTREGLLRAIRRGRPVVPVDDIPQLSPGAKSLLKSLLEPNPEKRMSCQNASEHYWVRERGAASHADSLASAVVERLQAYGTLGAVRRACLRAAFEEAEKSSFFDGDGEGGDFENGNANGGDKMIQNAKASTARLVAAVDEAAAAACAEAEECDVSQMWGDQSTATKQGVSAEALELALRDHGAELAPEEWLSLIRPISQRSDKAGKGGAFVRNAALAAVLASPLGGSFAEFGDEDDSSGDTGKSDRKIKTNKDDLLDYDWTSVAAASFRRIVAKDPLRNVAILSDATAAIDASITVAFDDVADEVCAWDDSETLCRATLREEFDAADADGDGRLGIMEWTDLVWSEGLMDVTGRVGSSCGAEAPEYDLAGPVSAGVGEPGCELAPETSVRRPPTELTPREKAKANAAARKKMSQQRAAAKAAKTTNEES